MRIQVLGPVCAWRDGELVNLGPTGQRALLGLLALAGGQPLSRAEIVDTLWGDRPPSSVANVIQTHVKHLRRLLEPARQPHTRSSILPHVGDGYALRVPAEDIDLSRFRRLVAAAAGVQQEGKLDQAAALLDEALRLWSGAPLADVPFLASHPKVVALLGERRAALARYGEVMIAAGAAADALPALEEAAATQPLDEAGQARLIRAYQAAGRRAQAFDTYHETRRRLADELGVDPGPELAAAHIALLKDETAPAVVPVPWAELVPRAGPVPAQLPADVPGFTGRASELSELDDLGVESTVVISAVSGTAGVGKTALAIHWAHRTRGRFPDGQLYVNLRGYDPDQPVTPGDALARFLRALGMPGHEIPLDIEERAACYRSLLDERRMLILLDNAASVEQVRPLLPGTAWCVVLVTSRDSLAGLVARHGASRLDLDLLPPGDATGLLRRLIGGRVDTEPDATAALVAKCARLPLALRVAAELAIARPEAPLAQLVKELADHQRRLELLDAGGDPRTGVRAVFSWSYLHLPADAARAFRLLGLHPGADLDPYAVAALAGTALDQAQHLLDVLVRANLVQRAGAGRYGMHDLLRAYASHLATVEDPDDTRRAALTQLFNHYLHTAAVAIDTLHPVEKHRRPRVPAPGSPTPPVTDPEPAQAWLDAERANLVTTAAHAATHGWPSHATHLTITLLRYLEGGGHFTDAIAIHTHGLHAARQLADRHSEAHIQTNFGVVYVQQGHHEQAAEHLQGALALFRDIGDQVGEARALGNLGYVYQWQGRYPESAEHLRLAATLCQDLGERAAEARALGNLGQVYLRQGRHQDAAEHLERAAALNQAAGDSIGEAYALDTLGHVCLRRGRFLDAAGHHERALTLFRQTNERAGEARALDGLGRALLRQGLRDDAANHLYRALALFRQLGDRAGESCALNSIGEALHAAGRPAKARIQHTSALTLAVEIGDRYEQARAHAGLAHSHHAAGDLEHAQQHGRQALTRYAELGIPDVEDIRVLLATSD